MSKTSEQTGEQLTLEMIPERYKAVLRAGKYMGVCVLQAPGSWTRMGPTWHVPDVGWYCLGLGVANWGTKRGLGELCVSTEPTPTWHAGALACSPLPNLTFAVVDFVRDHHGLDEIDVAAEKWHYSDD